MIWQCTTLLQREWSGVDKREAESKPATRFTLSQAIGVLSVLPLVAFAQQLLADCAAMSGIIIAPQVQVYGSGAASCIACASLPTAAQQDTCINCITNFSSSSSCSGCISWSSPGQLNVSATAACFDCVAAGGKERMSNSPCVQCLSVYPPRESPAGSVKEAMLSHVLLCSEAGAVLLQFCGA